MRGLDNPDKLALFSVATYDCIRTSKDCTDCPYFAHVENKTEEIDCGCISIYLKQIADKYYKERIYK